MNGAVSETFNPYRKWLGISGEGTPNHYRLLGLDLYESDPDVISTAADGRMVQVKQFASGERAQLSQRLLNEIAAARVTLLDPKKKQAYDAQLREKEGGAESGGNASVAAATAGKSPGDASESDESAIPNLNLDTEAASTAASRTLGRSRHRAGPSMASRMIGAVIGMALAAAIVYFGLIRTGVLGSFRGDSSGETARRETASVPDQPAGASNQPDEAARQNDEDDKAGDDEDTFGPLRPGVDDDDADPSNGDQSNNPSDDANPDSSDATAEEGSSDSESNPASPESDDSDDRSLADLMSENGGENGGTPPAATNGNDTGPLSSPSLDKQKEINQRLDELFAEEIAKARDPAGRMALAQQFRDLAGRTPNDHATRFVLLRRASETAARAGHPRLALEVAAEMAEQFDLNAAGVRTYLIELSAKEAPLTTEDGGGMAQVMAVAAEESRRAVGSDQFDRADRVLDAAVVAARRANDRTAVRRLVTQGRQLERLDEQHRRVEQARKTLESNPADGNAHLTLGRWLCLVKEEWREGIAHLAKADDPRWSAPAKLEVAGPPQGKDLLAAAQAWEALREKVAEYERPALHGHVVGLLTMATEQLGGLDRIEAQKLLAGVRQQGPVDDASSSSEGIEGVVEQGNVALASNGTKVSGITNGPQYLLDGDLEQQGTSKGVSYSKYPCEWVVTFDKAYRLREIRLLLGMRTPRFYRYAMAVSADGKTFKPLVDRSRGQWQGWQRIEFDPQPVKAVKIFGLYNSDNAYFAANEFEAYCVPPAH